MTEDFDAYLDAFGESATLADASTVTVIFTDERNQAGDEFAVETADGHAEGKAADLAALGHGDRLTLRGGSWAVERKRPDEATADWVHLELSKA